MDGSEKNENKEHSVKETLKGYFIAIFLAAAGALLVRSFLFEAFKIPTDFMSPTILAGDHIFINKTTTRRFGIVGPRKMPSRGDIVVFNFPNDPDKDFIKRVIAIEGDRVEIREGIVFVNSMPITKAMPSQLPAEGSPDIVTLPETLGSHSYLVTWYGTSAQPRNMSKAEVPSGEIFVLGDNRSRGQDSRNWGFISARYVQGRAGLIWFSQGASESEPFIRWKRIFKNVHGS